LLEKKEGRASSTPGLRSSVLSSKGVYRWKWRRVRTLFSHPAAAILASPSPPPLAGAAFAGTAPPTNTAAILFFSACIMDGQDVAGRRFPQGMSHRAPPGAGQTAQGPLFGGGTTPTLPGTTPRPGDLAGPQPQHEPDLPAEQRRTGAAPTRSERSDQVSVGGVFGESGLSVVAPRLIESAGRSNSLVGFHSSSVVELYEPLTSVEAVQHAPIAWDFPAAHCW